MSYLTDLIRPGSDAAVTKAIHNLDPDKFHEERIGPGACPLCPNFWLRAQEEFKSALGPAQDRLLARMAEHAERELEDVDE